MFELLSKYINDGNYQNALLVAQNMFNKNNGDKQVFDAYFSLLFKFILNFLCILYNYFQPLDYFDN